MKKNILVEITSALLILLFFYAAASKILDYHDFTIQISESPIIGNFGLSKALAWILPTIEIMICILLILPHCRLIGFYSSFGIMVLFTAYITYILTFSKSIPCNCGGIISKLSWQSHLMFNIFFTVIAFIGVLLQKQLQMKNVDNKIKLQVK